MGARRNVGLRQLSSSERRVIRNAVIARHGAVCYICLVDIDMSLTQHNGDRMAFTIDHFVAIADGGENTIENMRPAHALCNEKKGSLKAKGKGITRKPRSVSYVTGPRLAYTSSS